MDNTPIYLMIIGMALVTYLPRALPLVFLRNMEIHPFLLRFLKCIPYTILGGLIFPGILYSTGSFFSGITGCITAILLSWFGANLLITVLGSVFVTALTQLI